MKHRCVGEGRAVVVARCTGIALCVALLACSTPAGPDVQAICVAELRFEGSIYGVDTPLVQGELVPAQVVGQVARNLGCNDTPEPGDPAPEPMQDGDSNFLPAGTQIHAVEGFDASERLAVRPDTTWIFLSTLVPTGT